MRRTLLFLFAITFVACGGRQVALLGDGSGAPATDGSGDSTPDGPPVASGCEATCRVQNDCCGCQATTEPGPAPACAQICEAPHCDAVGIGAPIADCLNQHCLLASSQNRCSVDSDCVKVDDCCFCLAHPKNAPNPEASCAADCFVGACTARGLGAAVPRCVAGICKLTL